MPAESEHASHESCDVLFSVPRDKQVAWSRAIDEFVSGHEDATADSEQRSSDWWSGLPCG